MNSETAHKSVITHHQIHRVHPDHQIKQRRWSERPRNDKAKSAHCPQLLKPKKHEHLLYIPLQFRDYENHVLLDTCTIQGAMSESELGCILTAHSSALLQERPAPENKIQIASGNIASIKRSPTPVFSSGRHFWRNNHRSANHGQYPQWYVLFRDKLCDSGPQKQPGRLPRLVTTAQATSWEIYIWSFWNGSLPEKCSRPIPTCYGANHHGNRTQDLLRENGSYSWFHPKAWLHNDSGNERTQRRKNKNNWSNEPECPHV